MQFKEYLDFSLFIRRKLPHVTDEAMATTVQNLSFPEIPEDIFCLLDDTPHSYFQELKLHSSQKPFFKTLKADNYSMEHLPALCSLNTHFAISLRNRTEKRSDVQTSAYLRLKKIVDEVVEKIVKEGTAGSEAIRPFL